MRIGLITFHWSTNYGAVLQAYALSETLKAQGAQVDIIDYYPRKFKKNYFNAIKTRHIKKIKRRIKDVPKDKRIEQFRQKYFNRTNYYCSCKQLKRQLPEYDCYICGSDQIWNMSYIMHGEHRKTFVYFLDFAPKDKILASYAASFGVKECDRSLKDGIKEQLMKLDFVSVRENTGVDIIKDMGIDDVCVVPDPTLLLEQQDYEELITDVGKMTGNFVYILHNKYNDALEIVDYLKSNGEELHYSDSESVEQWIANIKNAKRVITNSFHGVVFSILFRKQFVAVLIKNSGMNDRLLTLLEKLGLEDRIYNGDLSVIDKPIDWSMVENNLREYKKTGFDYINKIIEKVRYNNEN